MAQSQPNDTSTIIDDINPCFSYTGVWTLANSSSTAHGSNVTGSTAVLTFNGTSVVLYGTVTSSNGNEPPVSSYSVDNGTLFTYTAPATNTTLFQQPFYTMYGLKPGVHTLTVTVKSSSPSKYWLDYALVSTGPDSAVGMAKTDSHMGRDLGAALGGIVLLLTAGLLWLWYQRRLRHRGLEVASVTQKFVLERDIETPEISSTSLPRPLARSKPSPTVTMAQLERGPSSPVTPGPSSFLPSPTDSLQRPPMDPTLVPISVLPIHSPCNRPAHFVPNITVPGESSNEEIPSGPSRPRCKGRPPPTTTTPRLHQDGGVRLQGGGLNDPETMIDVPPVYREY